MIFLFNFRRLLTLPLLLCRAMTSGTRPVYYLQMQLSQTQSPATGGAPAQLSWNGVLH